MFKTFVLIATLMNPNADAYVIDYDMSQDDCIAVMLEVAQSDGFEVAPGYLIAPNDMILSCEVDEHFVD